MQTLISKLLRRVSKLKKFNGRSSCRLGYSISMEGMGERVITMLDEIERRVENLRETGVMMEQEKESLMEMLHTVQVNKDMLRMSQSKFCSV